MSATPRTDAFFSRKPSGRSFIQEVKEQMSGLETELAAMTELAKRLAGALEADETATRMYQSANAHAEDAEGCGYSNDPTGAGHVTESYKQASVASEKAEGLKQLALTLAREKGVL